MRLADTRPPFAGLANLSWETLASLPTPCYLLDEGQLRRNGELLLGVQQRTGCKILLAQKAFSNFNVYPVLAPYLAGTEASGLYESRLGKEELPEKENHVFCAAYRADEFAELLQYADHIVFNSPSQLAKFGPAAKEAGKSVGLRLNPECSTQEGHAIYDPCALDLCPLGKLCSVQLAQQCTGQRNALRVLRSRCGGVVLRSKNGAKGRIV